MTNQLLRASNSIPTLTEHPGTCGRCRRCHPGRQFGGDSFCTSTKCSCHKWETP